MSTGIHPTAVVHPLASVSDEALVCEDAFVGRGAIVMAGDTIGAGARIGNNVVVCAWNTSKTTRTPDGMRVRWGPVVAPGAVVPCPGFMANLTKHVIW